MLALVDTVIVLTALRIMTNAPHVKTKELVPNKAFKEVLENFQQQKQAQLQDKPECNNVLTVKDILEQFHSGKVELNQVFLDQLAGMIAKKEKDEKISSMQC